MQQRYGERLVILLEERHTLVCVLKDLLSMQKRYVSDERRRTIIEDAVREARARIGRCDAQLRALGLGLGT